MDIASSLIRSIVRSFYTNEYILIVDALILHSTLRDDDLAYLMGIPTKNLRKLCGRLREDGLLSVHSVPEVREGAQRPFNRDYYFINFHRAIDVIKYRLKKMTRQIEQRFAQTPDEKKDFFCPQCKAEYTQMEVLDNPGPMGFECRRCGAVLTLLDNAGQAHTGHEIQSRLNAQLSAFEDFMRQIDNTSIPENDFDTARANHRPVQRDAVLNPAAKMTTLGDRDPSRLPPTSVRGTRNEPERIQVSLMDDSQAARDLEFAAEADRKARLAAQNALPSWHTSSTVTGEQTTIGLLREDVLRKDMESNGTTPKTEQEDEKQFKPVEDNSVINSYFAALKEEQEREAKRELEEQEDDDEDDEEEEDEEADFEEVVLGNGDLPAQKRVKIQEPGEEQDNTSMPITNGSAKATTALGGDSDEDEFEDVV